MYHLLKTNKLKYEKYRQEITNFLEQDFLELNLYL